MNRHLSYHLLEFNLHFGRSSLVDQQLVIEEANVSLIREAEYLWANKAEIGVDLCFRFNL